MNFRVKYWDIFQHYVNLKKKAIEYEASQGC